MKRLLLLLLLISLPIFADGITDLRRSCFQRALIIHPNYWLAECIQEMFSTEPVHLTIGTVAPGAGILAYGVGLSHERRFGQQEVLASGSAVRSTDGSFLLRGAITFALPPLGVADVSHDSARFGSRSRSPVAGISTLDAKASLTLTALRMEAKEQDFYGLGNTTDRSARAGYSLRLNDFGIVLNNPLFLWSSVGFDAHFLQPRSGLSSDTGIPPARDEFNEFTAAGITTRTDFLSFRPNLKIQIPPRRSTYVGLDLGYTFYHSLSDSSRYSFRRLSATTRVVYPIHLLAKRSAIFEEVTAPEQSVRVRPMTPGRWLREAVCWSERSGESCSLGNISASAAVDYSFTGAPSDVPFYFQDTLGGTDFDGNETLRGYADYRFRGPNRMYGQLEYRHPIWGPLGMLGFYDVGKVALDRSDLSIDHLHHNWGIGLYARIGTREIARVYFGFGTREGTQLHPKMGSLF